jgi:hypothetical protein
MTFQPDMNIENPEHVTRDNIDNLSFGMLRTLCECYHFEKGEDHDDLESEGVPIEDVIAALPTVRRALQQSGSWERLMDIIHG